MKRWLRSHDDSIQTNFPFREISYLGSERGAGRPTPLRFVYLALAVLALGILALTANVYQLHAMQRSVEATETRISDQLTSSATMITNRSKPIVWIHGRNMQTGYFGHVIQVFSRLGYETGHSGSDWDVLWAHDYPFKDLNETMLNLKLHQKVNHFPGSGYFTNKVTLAMTNSTHIPIAFRMPFDKEELFRHADKFPSKVFVQKSNKHRGIKVEKMSDLKFDQEGSFIQEFVQNPFLIDGRKFDIGVYTIVTSIDPLRVYVYNGDAILRFCSENYHPFRSEDVNKYVVGDDYTPIWEMPSLKTYYDTLGFTMKESLNAYLRSQDKNPNLVWLQIEDAIRDVLLDKEPYLIGASLKYKSTRNFYEMVRFDFVLDDNYKIHVMEANMSPNLSSAHFAPNKLLYEQVIFNVLSLVGVAHVIQKQKTEALRAQAETMRVSEKDLFVSAESCISSKCRSNCNSIRCRFCRPCLSSDWIQILSSAFREHMFKQNCRRIFPPHSLKKDQSGVFVYQVNHPLSKNNRIMMSWFEGKCRQDSSWC